MTSFQYAYGQWRSQEFYKVWAKKNRKTLLLANNFTFSTDNFTFPADNFTFSADISFLQILKS